MIASVSGVVQQVRLDAAVISVGGVGLLVQASPRTLAGLREGQQTLLATSLVVREDSLTLFGFADDDERATFEALQSVSGIGPRLALSLLAVHEPEALRRAIATDDLAALRKVPGVGLKSAQRMVLELKGKLGLPGAPGATPDGRARAGRRGLARPGPRRPGRARLGREGRGRRDRQGGSAGR